MKWLIVIKPSVQQYSLMGYRTGFTLLGLLRETRAMTELEEIHEFIDAATEFIQPGGTRRYQRGARLVSLLKRGALTALTQQEVQVAERLSNFADYAAGDLPLSLLEHNYVPDSREASSRMVQLMIKEGARRVAEGLETLLAERHDVGPDEVRHWIRGLVAAADHLSVGSGRGGFRLPRGGHDNLIWLSKVQMLLKDVPLDGLELDEVLAWPHATTLANLIELKTRRRILDELRRVVTDPDSTEHNIHRCLRGNYWMFGGTYVRELSVRNLTSHAVVDIPLLRGDGALHVIELKQANLPRLLVRYGSQIRTGSPIHNAVSQLQNYLRALDEDRSQVLNSYGINSRRAFGTVVAGHRDFIRSGLSAEDIAETLRTYNSHQSRIEVLTYDALIDSAERTLTLAREPTA